MTSPSKNTTLYSIQALRAIAAILVVLHHALGIVSTYLEREGVYEYKLDSILNNFGGCGVDIFFVISGFIMVYVSKNINQSPSAFKSFLANRLIRIVPMYWLFTTCALTILLIRAYLTTLDAAFLNSSTQFPSLWYVISSYLFIPEFREDGRLYPLITPGWTLHFEIYFYFLFSLSILFAQRFRLFFILIIFCATSTIGFFEFSSDNPLLITYTNPIVFEFLLGMLIAHIYSSKYSISSSVSALFVIGGFTALYIFSRLHYVNGHLSESRLLAYGIPSFFIVLGSISLEKNGSTLVPNWLVQLGNSSYSLYITHTSFSFHILIRLLFETPIRSALPTNLIAITLTILSIIIAHIIYVLIEKPTTARLKKHWSNRSKTSHSSHESKS